VDKRVRCWLSSKPAPRRISEAHHEQATVAPFLAWPDSHEHNTNRGDASTPTKRPTTKSDAAPRFSIPVKTISGNSCVPTPANLAQFKLKIGVFKCFELVKYVSYGIIMVKSIALLRRYESNNPRF
jgi:hypothetical protein